MPLVVFSGIPSSGKTTRALALQKHIVETSTFPVKLVNLESLLAQRNEAYPEGPTKPANKPDSRKEKETRASFKAFVERHLSPDTIVIVDSLNYIKGFRYELYCRARAQRTPCCVVFCDTPEEVAKQWNTLRTTDSFDETLFDDLCKRYETPDERNRWDKPLFVVGPDAELPFDDIIAHVKGTTTKPPNLATIPSPVAETTFVYELDKITQEIVTLLLEAQASRPLGDWVAFPSAATKVQLKRKYSLTELRRLRRQFLKITQTHRPTVDEIGNVFAEYLQTNL